MPYCPLTAHYAPTEFKEDVIQSLAGIPSNFELKKVTCNQIYAKVRHTGSFTDFPSEETGFERFSNNSAVLLTYAFF